MQQFFILQRKIIYYFSKMVVNVETVTVYAKEQQALKDSSAVVVNGYFKKAQELGGVQVEVDKKSLESNDKFKKVKISFKAGAVKMAYLNLMFHGSPVRSKKLSTDKFGKIKMSLSLPADSVVGMEKFGQYVYSQLKSQGVKLGGDARTLVYSDKNDESHWIYVEYDNKDKYLAAVLNGQELDVEAFNLLTMGKDKADIAVGVQLYLWRKDEDSDNYDYSIKFKLVNVQTGDEYFKCGNE
jgi:hypothetical protein